MKHSPFYVEKFREHCYVIRDRRYMQGQSGIKSATDMRTTRADAQELADKWNAEYAYRCGWNDCLDDFPGNFLLTRGSMVMVLREPFVQTARAKGLPPVRIRYAHAARNALLPMVTRFGLRIAFMITGALIVETIYAYPGLGTLMFNAIAMRDLPLIQGIVLFSSLLVLSVNLALEYVYGRIDPRIRNAF